MTDTNLDRLRKTLDVLDEQLDGVDGIDNETRARLDHIVDDIEFVLERTRAAEPPRPPETDPAQLRPKLGDRLSNAIVGLESSHPKIVSTLQRLSKVLADLSQ